VNSFPKLRKLSLCGNFVWDAAAVVRLGTQCPALVDLALSNTEHGACTVCAVRGYRAALLRVCA
jgi:hypothetical protein